jgi:hypothetical protein
MSGQVRLALLEQCVAKLRTAPKAEPDMVNRFSTI